MAKPASEKYMALVGMVALLTAGFLLLARIFKLGFLADFLSRTVLVGFLTGVGFQVGIAMLDDMFGVVAPSHRTLIQSRDPAGLAGSIFQRWGCGACGGQHLARPSFARGCLFAGCGGWDDCGECWVPFADADRGHWSGPRGLPSIKLPDVSWSETLALLPVAASCFVMIIAQSRDIACIRRAPS
jgi:MFS superfamily sulfate permease-like transporter